MRRRTAESWCAGVWLQKRGRRESAGVDGSGGGKRRMARGVTEGRPVAVGGGMSGEGAVGGNGGNGGNGGTARSEGVTGSGAAAVRSGRQGRGSTVRLRVRWVETRRRSGRAVVGRERTAGKGADPKAWLNGAAAADAGDCGGAWREGNRRRRLRCWKFIFFLLIFDWECAGGGGFGVRCAFCVCRRKSSTRSARSE